MSTKIEVMTAYLLNNGDVKNFLLPFCRICVESIKLDTCAKFDDHQRTNNKVMMGEGQGAGSSSLMVNKNPMSNRVKGARFPYDF